MKYIIRLFFVILLLTSCISENELWKIKKVELGNDNNVYLKSWTWGLRGEHARTIISENDRKEYSENKDIDIGQFTEIRYKVENEKFILLKSNNDEIRKQIKTEMKNVEIQYVSMNEFLNSKENYIEDFKNKN